MTIFDAISRFSGPQLAVYHAARESLRKHGRITEAVLEMHEAIHKAAPKRERAAPGHEYPRGRRLSKVIRGLFKNQKARVQDKIDQWYGKKRKESEDDDDLPHDDFLFGFINNPDEIEIWVKANVDPYTFYVRYGGEQTSARFGTSFDLEPWDVKQAVARSVLALSANANQVTQAQLNNMIPAIRQQIQSGLLEGTSYRAMSKEVANVFGKKADFRTDRIAQTEAVRAVNQGHMEAMKQTGGIVVAKQWGLSGDPCEVCVAIKAQDESRQQALAIDQAFAKTSAHPDYGVVYAPPAHPNCMCFLEEIVRELPARVGVDETHYLDDYSLAVAR